MLEPIIQAWLPGNGSMPHAESLFQDRRIVPFTLKCSATSQDSKEEKSREVAMPPKKRPSIRI